MELTREHFRAIIFYNFRHGLSEECIEELISLSGDRTPSCSTVKNWFNEFNCGRRSLKDEVRKHPLCSKTSQIQRKLYVEKSLHS